MQTTSRSFPLTRFAVHPFCRGARIWRPQRDGGRTGRGGPRLPRTRSSSFPTRTGKGRSSRRARNISTWGCPTSCARSRCSRPIPTTASCSIRRATSSRSWNATRKRKPRFRKFVDEGRLAIVGGTDVMLDVNMPGGESFVRQVLYGKGYFREKLGVDVTVGWQLDTFGHHAQMPQLLKLGGYQSFWFFRGVADWDVPAEFLWEGIDGSRIPAFWLPHGYAAHLRLAARPARVRRVLPAAIRCAGAVRPRRGPSRVGRRRRVRAGGARPRAGRAVQPPAGRAVRTAHRRARPTTKRSSAQRPDRPVVRGELNPIFQGAYSSRIELKQRTRELERLLTTAEKLDVMLRWLGRAGR